MTAGLIGRASKIFDSSGTTIDWANDTRDVAVRTVYGREVILKRQRPSVTRTYSLILSALSLIARLGNWLVHSRGAAFPRT